MIARTPIRKRRPGKRRGPIRDKAYLAWIQTFPCFVCFKAMIHWIPAVPSEAAHLAPSGLGQKCSDRETGPLCSAHHRTGRDSHHVLGKRFWAHHGLDRDKIIEELSALYEEETKGR